MQWLYVIACSRLLWKFRSNFQLGVYLPAWRLAGLSANPRNYS